MQKKMTFHSRLVFCMLLLLQKPYYVRKCSPGKLFYSI